MAVDVIARALAARADSKSETAYGYAVEGGYTGTEQQFGEDLGQIGNNAQVMSNAVRFDEAQSKSDAEKEQAQSNIGLDVALGDIDAQIANKANPDGLYESLTTGYTYNFTSDTFIVDKEPYNYRTAGGSADVGDREDVEMLVGGTLALNQLYTPRSSTTVQGVPFSSDEYGKITFSGTSTTSGGRNTAINDIHANINVIAGHKYLITTSLDMTNLSIFLTLISDTTKYVSVTKNGIVAPTFSGACRVGFNVTASTEYNTSGYINIIDLTAMFGSDTIPTYLYGLTQANALSWLYKYFPILNGGYIPYSTPSLQSTCADEHIMDGFNQWDEEWESGRIKIQDGTNSTGNGLRSKNYIKVLPSVLYGTTFGLYVGNTSMFVYYYDVNKGYMYYESVVNGRTFTIPSNCYFIRFALFTSSGVSAYNNDICIHLEYDGERDGEYAPYESHTYAMGHDELRGIYTLDADNNLFLDPTKNDTKSSDGTITRRFGIVDLGTLTWVSFTASSRTAYKAAGQIDGVAVSGSNGIANAICMKYSVVKNGDIGNTSLDKVIAVGAYWSSGCNVYIYDSAFDGYTGTQVATALNGVYLVYELATPTTESGTAYTETQWADNWGTEQFTDYAVKQGTRSVPLPVGHVTKYPPDLKAKLEMFPESPDGDGDYIVRQSNGLNSYVSLPNELPPAPTEDGQYKLKAIVSDGVVTPTWVAMQ